MNQNVKYPAELQKQMQRSLQNPKVIRPAIKVTGIKRAIAKASYKFPMLATIAILKLHNVNQSSSQKQQHLYTQK